MAEYGYAGEILKVDLSGGGTSRLDTAAYAEKYIGGHGLAARLYWEMVPPDAGALDPENCFICASGPVMGFTRFAGFRWKVCARTPPGDPETFSYCNLGERWGALLKYAGYDALVVRGKAEKPVYIIINDDKVEVKDASHLWGTSAFDAIDNLKAEHGKDTAVLAVGPAGENMVSFATILADRGASGSGGLGAVMGSKNLKAIVVAGSGRPVAAHPERLNEISARIRELRPGGDMPSPWAIPGLTKPHICYGCGLGCGRQMYHEHGRDYKVFCQAQGVYAMPVMRHFGKWDKAQLIGIRVCDGYGFDTSVMVGLINWLGACYREGLLSEADAGLPLSKFGTEEFINELGRKIAFREGFGDILARGTIAAAAAVGEKASTMLSNFVATRGSETRDYDPRLMITTSLLYATEPRRPIQQLHSVSMPVMMWLGNYGGDPHTRYTTADLKDTAGKFWGGAVAADFSTLEGKARAAMIIQDRVYAKESLVLCDLRWPLMWSPVGAGGDPALEARIFSAVTGRETDEAGLNAVGKRIFNLQRAILLREGWQGRRGDALLDYFHTVPLRQDEIFFDPDGVVPGRDGEKLSRVGKVVERDDFETLKDEYYQLRGWDVASGLPTREKLSGLGLDDVAADLEQRGLIR